LRRCVLWRCKGALLSCPLRKGARLRTENTCWEIRVSSSGSVHAIEAQSVGGACTCNAVSATHAGWLRFCGAVRAVAAQTLIFRLLFLSLTRPRVLLLQMVRGPKKHLKRLNAPRHWMLDKLGGVFAPKPAPGAHGCLLSPARCASPPPGHVPRSALTARLCSHLCPVSQVVAPLVGVLAPTLGLISSALPRRSTQVSGVPATGADCAQPTEVCAHVQGGDFGGQVAGNQG
jgi:RS4NT (NUC023) domain